MSETLNQAAAAPGESLWQQAPAWRKLTMMASFLTLAAVAVPALLPREQPVPAPPPAELETVSATPSVTLPPLPPPARAAALAPAQPACSLTLSRQPQSMGAGLVIGFEAPMQARQRSRANERALGAPIAPAYAITPRLIVRMDGSNANAGNQVVVVPPGMGVRIGDRITFDSIHRDPVMACAFVPPLVTADLGPAQRAPASPAEAAEAAHESASP